MPADADLMVAVVVALPPAVKVTLAGLNVAVAPLGSDVAERVIVPANPLILVTVMVDVLVRPAANLTVVGLAAIVKSVTVTLTVRVAARVFEKPVVVFVTV